MTEHTPYEGLQQHERDFITIRSQGRYVSGLEVARSLIHQCRLVRYRRLLELSAQAALKDQAKAARAEEVENAFLHPSSRASRELSADGQPLTVAEARALQGGVTTVSASETGAPIAA